MVQILLAHLGQMLFFLRYIVRVSRSIILPLQILENKILLMIQPLRVCKNSIVDKFGQILTDFIPGFLNEGQ